MGFQFICDIRQHVRFQFICDIRQHVRFRIRQSVGFQIRSEITCGLVTLVLDVGAFCLVFLIEFGLI